ncbi:phosphotransferase [Microbacterium lushaniae]|uniref:Phosphotransferase n=1 Tax=Microbacterium lushaniae TaxID=2614639 RepID=A0A5J6L725_9MICO|nr:phosphotransferase [Microbacterium lushaniae]QEW04333.1 phosphotransferase [Microbacterium lushaniae]
MDIEELQGGVANFGQVIRVGPHVRRPLPPNAATLHALLRYLRTHSRVEAPVPVAIDGSVEVVEYLVGDVALSPRPSWAGTEGALVSVARLLRMFHDATVAWRIPANATWSSALADPAGGPVVCHNDVCIENVVFRRGKASALLDFDFAAPGRRVWDVAQTARYWVPITNPDHPAAASLGVRDPIGRLRQFVNAYGLDSDDRREFVGVLLDAELGARRFVESQVATGAPGFVDPWTEDAARRYDGKIAWIQRHSDAITDAMMRPH